jgi:hypothetical protein
MLPNRTPAHQIYSESGFGKADQREMGIKPWRQVQPILIRDHLHDGELLPRGMRRGSSSPRNRCDRRA